MKKNVLTLVLLFAASFTFTFAQTVVFSDNFDSYAAGSHLAQSNSAWTTWTNTPGGAEDGVITSAQAASAPNSLYITGSSDQVYPFGNYTTGHYLLTFNYYIPSSGNGAYFNIQHVLLSQWALECYFNNNGTGYLFVGGSEYNFTYPSNSWFPIEFDVDMDDDEATLTINGELVLNWPFHYHQGNTNGINKLAGINFYAGAPNGSGSYYVDDFVVTELSAALVSEFDVSTENLTFSMNPAATSSQSIVYSNPGTGSTDFYTLVTYDIPNPNTTPTTESELTYSIGDPHTFLGWTGEATEVEVAICIPSSSLQQHIGKTLNEIHIFMNNSLPTAKVLVHAMSNMLVHPEPGAVLYEQTFVPDSGWNSIQLNTPFLIDGGDLWFGVSFVQPEGAYLVPLDGSPANDYSCWYKLGTTWYSRFTNYDYNLCLGGKVNGTPINPWLTVSPQNGSLLAGETLNQNVTANSAGKQVGQTYSAKLHCYSNCYENNEVTLNITMNITDVAVNEYNQIEVSVYPNPATEFVQINSENIERVEIFNMLGQQVFGQEYGDNHVVISTAGMAPGNYVVKVTTSSGTMTKQVVIK